MKKKEPDVIVPEGYIRVHGVNYKIPVALEIARQLREVLSQYRREEKFQSGKGRDYVRTLEDKLECINREISKKEKK